MHFNPWLASGFAPSGKNPVGAHAWRGAIDTAWMNELKNRVEDSVIAEINAEKTNTLVIEKTKGTPITINILREVIWRSRVIRLPQEG